MNIDKNVIVVLAALQIEGQNVRIAGQLDRNLYVQTNKVLEALGGKWDRKAKAHVFNDNPKERIATAIETQSCDPKANPLKKFAFFPTPLNIAQRLLMLAALTAKMKVLEPSAGHGALADLAVPIVGKKSLTLYEILPENAQVLEGKGYAVNVQDFLTVKPKATYDRVIMNPPFDGQQDIDHVNHAFKFLKPGGRLVSVMASGITFRENKKTQDFMSLVESCGKVEENPEGSFKESGTGVNTVLVTLNKAA